MRSNEAGFSLWEMALWLTFLGGLASVVLMSLNLFMPQARSVDQARLLDRADKQIQSFLLFNGRLPCPDVNGDGLEGSAGVCALSETIGTYPWRTMGFKSAPDSRGVARLSYGVYRNSGASADLAVASDLFNPTTSRAVVTTFGQINALDMCGALSNASGAGLNTAFLHVAATPNRQVAYVIADAGEKDADADGSMFDGANSTLTAATPAYDPPELAWSANNDDRTITKGFNALLLLLQCDTATRSLDMLADAHRDAIAEVQSLAADINASGGTAAAVWTDTSVPSLLSQADALGLAQ